MVHTYIGNPSLAISQGDFELDGGVGVGGGRAGAGGEGGTNLVFLGVVAVLAFLLWWTCRRHRKKPRGRRSLIAKFPIV